MDASVQPLVSVVTPVYNGEYLCGFSTDTFVVTLTVILQISVLYVNR